jgi:hypothetical protein
MLAAGTAAIFAAFINNKVPVYLPHLLVGFALASGFVVSEAAGVAARWFGGEPGVPALIFVLAYCGAGVAYYEKWYSVNGKSELVPYEATSATLRTLVPPGPKYLYASPQFWVPFHAEPGTTFYSYTGPQPAALDPALVSDRPIFLLVDEQQWLPELTAGTSTSFSASTPSSAQTAWRQRWTDFIEQRCALDGVALGTAHGTIALYRCALGVAPPGRTPRIVGGSTEYEVGQLVMSQSPPDLAKWTHYDDPRRTPVGRPVVRPAVTEGGTGLQIAGTGWPGIITTFPATPGACYLVRLDTRHTRTGDLLYVGTWKRPEARSLGGASATGVLVPLIDTRWFPPDRAFRAVAPAVQLLVYSEAPETDFAISSLDIYRLLPIAVAKRQRGEPREVSDDPTSGQPAARGATRP